MHTTTKRQTKFSCKENQVEFLSNYKNYGFKDKSAMVRESLNLLREKLEAQRLRESADLYAETYNEKKARIKTNVTLTPSVINGLDKKSVADCLQTRPIDYRLRLSRVRGKLEQDDMRLIETPAFTCTRHKSIPTPHRSTQGDEI
jgi:hypothetical protein